MHGRFHDPGGKAKVGDSVLFCHCAQVIQERCYVAAVSGVSEGRPVVEGLCDSAATVLDRDFNPVNLDAARASVARVAELYATKRSPGAEQRA
jgi:hypothetical protein